LTSCAVLYPEGDLNPHSLTAKGF